MVCCVKIYINTCVAKEFNKSYFQGNHHKISAFFQEIAMDSRAHKTFVMEPRMQKSVTATGNNV